MAAGCAAAAILESAKQRTPDSHCAMRPAAYCLSGLLRRVMLLLNSSLLLIASSAAAAATATNVDAAAAVSIQGTVEHLTAPLGIATLHPRFSWQLFDSSGKRNVTQISYNLRIDTTGTGGGAAHCSSGVVASSASNLVECGGTSLKPGRLYWWTVAVMLSDGTAATMSPQRFSTGLQSRQDWDTAARFIGLPQRPLLNRSSGSEAHCPWLRSESFAATQSAISSIGNGTASALLSVASIGWHEVYLNGVQLESASVLIPSVSDLHHRVLSHQYDVSSVLRAGTENVLAFWAAPGWSQLTWPDKGGAGSSGGQSFNISAAPLVMAQLSLCEHKTEDCSVLVLTSASSGWKARQSTIEHRGSWQWADYGGESIDWTKDLANWSTTAPTTEWLDAATFQINDQLVTPESLEAMAVVETLPATGLAPCNGKAAGSCYVISFPRLFNGFFSASSLPGLQANQNVTFSYSANCLTPEPAPKPATDACCKKNCAVLPYICPASTPPTRGTGVCTSAAVEWNAIDSMVVGETAAGVDNPFITSFANKFNWHTFQFVVIEISGVAGTLTLTDADLSKFEGRRITNAQTKIGQFTSSVPMLNKIYEAHVQTYEGLTVSGMHVDCTNRERLGYGGDAHSRLEFAMDSYSSHALYSKWLTDWRDAQLVGAIDNTGAAQSVFGNVPNTAPTYNGAGGPMWGGITVLVPYELFRRHGDKRMLAAAYPIIEGFLSFMIHFAANTTDGLVHADGFDWLGDWQAPHGCADGDDASLYNNAYIVYALKRSVEIITAIGDESIAPRSDGIKFTAAADSIGAAVHKVFFNSALQRYGPTVGSPRQGHQILPLAAGLVPAHLVSTVLDALVDELTNSSGVAKAHIDTGLHTTYFMGKMFSGGMENIAGAGTDRADLIYSAAMNPTWPSFSALITAGLTTWPETWAIGNVAGGVSKMHGTLNGFGLTFPQAILGVTLPLTLDNTITGGAAVGYQIRPSYYLKPQMFPPPPPPDPCRGKSKSLRPCKALAPPPPTTIPGLTAASGTVATVHGLVNISWVDSGASTVTLHLEIPIGAHHMTVWLVGKSAAATESGKLASTASGVRFVKETTRNGESYSVWAVGSGSFAFSSHR